jgi:hypothetical protein
MYLFRDCKLHFPQRGRDRVSGAGEDLPVEGVWLDERFFDATMRALLVPTSQPYTTEYKLSTHASVLYPTSTRTSYSAPLDVSG